MKREDIQPAISLLPDVTCPKCKRVGKYQKWTDDLGTLFSCSFKGCGYTLFVSWTDLDALKEKAS